MLHDKYILPRGEADLIASFLGPMLRLNPEKRAKGSELVHHAWLDGVLVQGEINLIRRAEEEELRRKETIAGALSPIVAPEERAKLARADERHHIEEQIDADAMKPVDDLMSTSDAEIVRAPPITATTSAKENAFQPGSSKARFQVQPPPHSLSGNQPSSSKKRG